MADDVGDFLTDVRSARWVEGCLDDTDALRQHAFLEIDKADSFYARSLLKFEQRMGAADSARFCDGLSREAMLQLHARMSAVQNCCSDNFAAFAACLKGREIAVRRRARQRLDAGPDAMTVAAQMLAAAKALEKDVLGELHQRRFVECRELRKLATRLEHHYALCVCGGSWLAARTELIAASSRALRAKLGAVRKANQVSPLSAQMVLRPTGVHTSVAPLASQPGNPTSTDNGGVGSDLCGRKTGVFAWLDDDPALSFVLRASLCTVVGSILCFVDSGTRLSATPSALAAYRCVGGATALTWLCGVSLHVWSAAHLNYAFLFEMQPGDIPDYTAVYNVALDASVFFLLSLFAFKMCQHLLVQPDKALLVPALTFVAAHRWFYSSRLTVHLRNVTIAPFAPVNFFSVMLGDYLTSAVKLMIDYAATLCALLSGEMLQPGDPDASVTSARSCSASAKDSIFGAVVVPIVIALPLWWRFQQCIHRYHVTGQAWPNLANSLKYALCMMVSLFVIFHPIQLGDEAVDPMEQVWLVVAATAYLYAFWWDVRMDWGLGHCKHAGLARTLVLGSRSLYYSAIAIDLMLRFLWTLSLIPPSTLDLDRLGVDLTACLMIGELLRRTMWSLFRVEHEQHNNAFCFRATKLVPMPTQHDACPGEMPPSRQRRDSLDESSGVLALDKFLSRRQGFAWIVLLAEVVLLGMMMTAKHGLISE